ncbi:MAG TPA: universal stress protein [Allosphingosinicella sp.]
MIRSIAHPTDLSREGESAFEHALSLAMAHRCHLDVLHVRGPGGGSEWKNFPHVREVLQRWNILEPGARIEDIQANTGVSVRKVDIRDSDPILGLSRFLQGHPSELIVLRSHGRAGLERWLASSVSAELARETRIATLILGPESRPFVDPATGRIDIATVLVPVDHEPAPDHALAVLESLVDGLEVELDYVHVGDDPPRLLDARQMHRPVRTIGGPVVETLVAEAQEAGLIAMPTAGRHGLLDALRGSTMERVVRAAPCPVLAIPAG